MHSHMHMHMHAPCIFSRGRTLVDWIEKGEVARVQTFQPLSFLRFCRDFNGASLETGRRL